MRNEFGYDGVFVVGQGRVERCLGQFSELIARDPARMAVSDRERPCEDVRRSVNLAAIGQSHAIFWGALD